MLSELEISRFEQVYDIQVGIKKTPTRPTSRLKLKATIRLLDQCSILTSNFILSVS